MRKNRKDSNGGEGHDAKTSLSRRTVLTSGVALSLARILSEPALAAESASRLQSVTIKTPSGRDIAAAWAKPAKAGSPAIVLVHEWWGLNDQIKAVAVEFARLGYGALAVDLYGGQVATDPDTAKTLASGVKDNEAGETLSAWIDWLRASPVVDGGIATCGWCFGGGWSLAASLLRPVEATVIYYGNVARSADELRKLKGPVLGHFASRDQYINHKMVEGFEAAMKKAGRHCEIYWYEADHAFANPTTARYDEANAKLAWSRTVDFLKKTLA